MSNIRVILSRFYSALSKRKATWNFLVMSKRKIIKMLISVLYVFPLYIVLNSRWIELQTTHPIPKTMSCMCEIIRELNLEAFYSSSQWLFSFVSHLCFPLSLICILRDEKWILLSTNQEKFFRQWNTYNSIIWIILTNFSDIFLLLFVTLWSEASLIELMKQMGLGMKWLAMDMAGATHKYSNRLLLFPVNYNFRQLLELQEYNCSMIAHRLNILSYCWCFFLPSTWYPITFHCRAMAHATKTMLKESPRDFIKRQINDHLQVIITSICYLECIIADDNQQMDWLQQQTTEMISQSNQILKTNKKKLQHKLSRARSSQLRFACDNKFESCRKSCSCSVRYVQAQEKQKEKLFIYYSWMRAIIAFAPLLF